MNEQLYLEKFKLLTGMALLLQTCTREKELVDVIDVYLPRLFPDVSGEFFLQVDSGKEIQSVLGWGTQAQTWPLPDFKRCRSFTCSVVVNDRENLSQSCQSCHRGECCVPLCDGDHAFGMLCLNTSQPLQAGYRGLAFVTAEYLALAICNLRLKKRLHELTVKDALTGLFNRRHMDEVIPRELLRAKRAGTSCGAIMIDLDHFKRVNDTFGHDGGDVVLKKVGKFLNSMFRQEDVVCRFGGEEFFVLMTSGEVTDYCRRAQALGGGIKALDIRWNGQQISPVTVSMGVAVFPNHATSFEELLKVADQALYLAKARGRDRVVVEGDLELPCPGGHNEQ